MPLKENTYITSLFNCLMTSIACEEWEPFSGYLLHFVLFPSCSVNKILFSCGFACTTEFLLVPSPPIIFKPKNES